MDESIIYVRTDKGNRALLAPGELGASLNRVLAAIDGVTSVDLLRVELGDPAVAELEQLLTRLARDELIRDSAAAPFSATASTAEIEHRRLARELREKVRARREGQVRPKSAGDTPSESRMNLGDQVVEEQAPLDAEEWTSAMVKDLVQVATEETTRPQAQKESVREEIKKPTRQETESSHRRLDERPRQQTPKGSATKRGKGGSRPPRRWGRVLASGFVLAAVGLAIGGLVAIKGQRPRLEKSLSVQFQQPVRIKALGLGLVPRPHLWMDGLEIGGEGQIKVARVRASGGFGALFGDRKNFTAIDVESPTLSEQGMGWVLFGQPTNDMSFGAVSVTNARIESRHLSLPPFNAIVQPDAASGWHSMTLASTDKNSRMTLIARGASVQFDVTSVAFPIPFGSALTLDEFVAKGSADRNSLTLTEFKGFVSGGTLGGTARLAWGANWDLTGELDARQIDAARFVPRLLAGARVAATARYSMGATEASKLFAAPRLEGSFAIAQGTLLGADLGGLLLRGTRRGDTRFADLGGQFVYANGATQVRQLSLKQDTLHGQGMVDVGADGNVRGRLAVQLRLSTEQRRANLAFSGTLEQLEWSRQ